MLGVRALCEYALCEFADLELPPEPEPEPDPDPGTPPTQETPPAPLATVVQRFATHSFTTRSTDTPSNQPIAKRLNRGLVMGRRINAGPEGQFGGLIISSFGEIEFVNNDGGLDSLADNYFIDGRPITIKVGNTEVDAAGREIIIPFDNFSHAYTATAGAWEIQHDTVLLRIKDPGIVLQRPLQTAKYAGTGGQQGTTDMAGRTVPVSLGRVLNITPQQVDPVFLTYQVHDGTVQDIWSVYDAGVRIDGEGGGSPSAPTNYASYAALIAASVTAGKYATSLSSGHFRLGTSPVGAVTADVDGDNTDADWTATHGTILLRILRKYSGLTEAKINAASFTTFHNQNNDVIGLYLPPGDQSTIEEVIERIALSGGAACGQDRDGLYRVVRLDPPLTTADHEFTDRTIMAIERLVPPYGVPFKSWSVEGVRNWTVQHSGDVATSVTQSRKRFLESETRQKTIEVPNVARAHPTSAVAIRASLFNFISQTEDEAIRLAGLYALGRTLYRLVVKTFLFEVEIGQTVRITYPRWNLSQGKNFVVVAVSDDTDSKETDIEVFG